MPPPLISKSIFFASPLQACQSDEPSPPFAVLRLSLALCMYVCVCVCVCVSKSNLPPFHSSLSLRQHASISQCSHVLFPVSSQQQHHSNLLTAKKSTHQSVSPSFYYSPLLLPSLRLSPPACKHLIHSDMQEVVTQIHIKSVWKSDFAGHRVMSSLSTFLFL